MKIKLHYIIGGFGFILWIIYSTVLIMDSSIEIVPFLDISEMLTNVLLYLIWPIVLPVVFMMLTWKVIVP